MNSTINEPVSLSPLQSRQDSPWKEMLEHFEPFMNFFFPSAHAEIDWSNKVRFLDKELQQILYGRSLNPKVVDKLVEVQLKNLRNAWVLVHIEVQSQKESDFARRIFQYNYRIFEKYNQPVSSFAVLADANPTWKPNCFFYQQLGCEVGIKFPVAKILDYRERWTELEKSRNPFATVVMIHLKDLETRKNLSARFNWKLNLAKMMYRKGYSKREIVSLFKFMAPQ